MNPEIKPPPGWRLLAVGEEVPHIHREYIKDIGWVAARRCHSTMTPIKWTGKWGDVLAYAAVEKPKNPPEFPPAGFRTQSDPQT